MTLKGRFFILGLSLLCGASPCLKAQEFTEGNAALWGTFSSEGAASSVTDGTARVKVGNYALHFETLSGFDTGVRYPKTGSVHLNLTSKNFLKFWTYAVNPNPSGFQGNQPVVVLKSPNGSFRYEPQSTLTPNRAWKFYQIPLEGNSTWVRTVTGFPTMADITQIEIHQDTWDYGFSMDYDGFEFISFTPGTLPPAGPPPPAGVNPHAIDPKVLLYIYDPIMPLHGGLRMHTVYGWDDPVSLTNRVMADLRSSSHDLARFRIVQTQIDDTYPFYEDGFQYDDFSFDQAYAAGNPHQGTFDYARFIREKNLAQKVDAGEIDEVWIYALPYAGMWESAMAGEGAYWINGPSYPAGERVFAMMGWNFERGAGEAIHSFGHRAEGTMVHSYGSWEANLNHNWNKFALLDKDLFGQGGVGNVHYPVNGTSDYDYNNSRIVSSGADDWNNYPTFTGVRRSFNAREWSPNGTDPQREYLNWWYGKMPHQAGRGTDYFLANWWRYLTDLEQFKSWNGNLYFSDGLPAVTTVFPTNGAAVSGKVTVRANASVQGALGRVDLYVDGAYFASDTLAPYTFDWNTTGLTGIHTLQTKAYELQNGTEAVSSPISVTVSPPVYTVSGTLNLEGISASAPAQPITFTLRKTGSPDQMVTLNVGPNGAYTLSAVSSGTYVLRIKGQRYLAKNIALTVANANYTVPSATFLLAGDVNNNNVIDVDDLTLLLNVYNTRSGDGIYSSHADLNLDGRVDVDDLTLLLRNYNTSGSRPRK